MSLRTVAFVALLLATSRAHADDKADAEKVVHNFLGGSSAALAKGAQVLLHGAPSGAPPFKLEKLHVDVVSSPGYAVAWFHGTGKTGKDAARINGLATEENGWKIVAIAYSRVTPDADLVDRANKAAKKLVPPAAPRLLGDKQAAGCVAEWFGPKKKLADGIGFGEEVVIASGTSATEHVEGKKFATRLVGSWDALKLRPVEIEATVHNGTWWVRALVGMPIAGQKHMAPLVLTAVAGGAGMSCAWYSLHWADHTPVYK